jgi:hypothetical protein
MRNAVAWKLARPGPNLGVPCLILLLLGLSACGSTKVYTADKTVVYYESVYNVANVKVITRKSSAVLADQSVIDLVNMDEDGFQPLLAISPSIAVRQEFLLDDIALVYQQANVSSWKEFRRLDKRFQSASKDLNKFLANSKKTQLKLK